MPGQVVRPGTGAYAGHSVVTLPGVTDLADTAFTNHHCLRYAGQERFGGDSVIRVDFEPVPWVAREVDLVGSSCLRADGEPRYQLAGLVTRLNRIPRGMSRLADYTVRARFRELVGGVPVLAEWELTNTFRGNAPPWVQTGRSIDVQWQGT